MVHRINFFKFNSQVEENEIRHTNTSRKRSNSKVQRKVIARLEDVVRADEVY